MTARYWYALLAIDCATGQAVGTGAFTERTPTQLFSVQRVKAGTWKCRPQ